MQIIINNTPMEFVLDNEKQLKDLSETLFQFILDNKHYITEIKIDSKVMTTEEVVKSQQAIESIEVMEIFTKEILLEVQEVLSHISEYSTNFLNEVKNPETLLEHQEDYFLGIKRISEAIETVVETLNLSPRYIFKSAFSYETIMFNLKQMALEAQNNKHDKSLCVAYLKGCSEQLQIFRDVFIPHMIDLYNFFHTPKDTFSKEEFSDLRHLLLEETDVYLSTFETIPEMLSQGQDKEALDLIQQAIYLYEFVNQVLLRLQRLDCVVNISEFEPLREELIDSIESISFALKEQDMVTTSDLLEYEYLEKMKEFIKLLEKISFN